MSTIAQMIDHTSIRYDKLIRRIAEPLQHQFGITYFCYQFVSNEGHWFTLGNRPDWLSYSAEQQFYQCDPSLIRPKHYRTSGVSLPKYHQNETFQETLGKHCIEVFDVNHPLALVEPNPFGCEYYFFGAPTQHEKVLAIYLNHLKLLRQDFTHFFKTQINPIMDHCLSNAVDLNKVNPIGFNSDDNMLATNENLDQEVAFLNALHGRVPLSMREQQCLKLYQQGLTAKETARRLDLSFRTIEEYFENIKLKYQVNHKRELLRVSCPPVDNTDP